MSYHTCIDYHLKAMKFLRDVSIEVTTRMKEVDGTAKRVILRVQNNNNILFRKLTFNDR